MPVEAHRLPNEGVELAHQKIGQVEGGKLLLRRLGKDSIAFKKRITMGSFQHLHAQFLALFLQLAARAAIGIENKHLLVALGVTNGLLNGCGNAVGPEMQVRRQALQIQMIPAALLARTSAQAKLILAAAATVATTGLVFAVS